MKLDLVLSRGCRHADWVPISQTPIEFCLSCGFALIFAASPLPKDAYAEVQIQPQSGATFELAQKPGHGVCRYDYTSLDLVHGRQIRILVLKSGNGNDPLRCELEHANLQQGPTYEAVSYTWADQRGDDSTCRKIQCGNGNQFLEITKNCEAALLRLRRRDEDRRLWVDAVCIDQSNVQERNHQVKNMIAIFRSAIRVVVFLGQGKHTLERLVDYVSNDSAGQLPQVFDSVSLFQSRWFHRVWILQEVAVAKNILVIYGEKQMGWKDLLEHSNLFLRLMASRNLPLVLPPVISYGLLQTTTRHRQLQGKSDILSLLQVSRNCSCKDARDKVYAILGLLQDQSALPLQADYSSSTTAGWVFLQAAAWHVYTTNSLNILSQVDGISKMNMPSWVPDWTIKSLVSLPAQFDVSKSPSVPRIISPDGRPLAPAATLDYPLKCVLQVEGRRLGTVWTNRKAVDHASVSKPSNNANASVPWTAGTSPYQHSAYSRPYYSWADPVPYGKNITVKQNHPPTTQYREIFEGHWLHNPSQNVGTRCCSTRLDFWSQIFSLCSGAILASDFEADYKDFKADVPPSFGGLCKKCYEMDNMFKTVSDRRPCYCTMKSSEHFDNNELEEFRGKVFQHGQNRKIFGTDHSIGFGPMEIENWDEIWILEGSEVPFILRLVGKHYRLIGACYVHAASRRADRCSCCSCGTDRKEIMIRPKLDVSAPAKSAASNSFGRIAGLTTHTPSGIASLESSRVSDIKKRPFRFEELLTTPLQWRPKEVEIS